VLLLSDQHGRRMFETVHLQIKPTGGGHGKHGGAFIVFNHSDQASRFHYKTIELLIDAVPQYWGRIIQSTNQLGHNVLRMAREGLTPMDPYSTATVRGVVEPNWIVLRHITEVWVKHYA
jgi:hypothetical protein